MPDSRLTYRRRASYNTKSNKVRYERNTQAIITAVVLTRYSRVSRTPGGKLVYLKVKKAGTAPK